VFAAGFPFDAYWSGPGSLPSQPADFVVAKQVLIGGGIGYTNEIEKGMSGDQC